MRNDFKRPPLANWRSLVQQIQDTITRVSSAWTALTAHKADVSNPHQVQLDQLIDIDKGTPLEVGTAIVYTNAIPATPWERLNIYTASAYGGIRQSVSVAMPDVGISWVDVLFDSAILTTPRGIVQDFSVDGIRFTEDGVFNVTISLTLNFTLSQFGRNIQIRLLNATTSVGGVSTVIAVGRNQDGLNFSTSIMTEIPDTVIGDLFKVQVAALTAGDVLEGVTELNASFAASAISEYRG